MTELLCFAFSIFIAIALGQLKIHHQIELSWFWIGLLTLFWEIPAILGLLLGVVVIIVCLPFILAALLIPFAVVGLVIWGFVIVWSKYV